MIEVPTPIKNAISVVQQLSVLAKKIENAELNMLLADLRCELGDAKLEAAHLKTQLAKSLEENEVLRKCLDVQFSAEPMIDGNVYQFEGKEGRYCTACFDVHQKQVRVTALPPAFRAAGEWQCPSCNAPY